MSYEHHFVSSYDLPVNEFSDRIENFRESEATCPSGPTSRGPCPLDQKKYSRAVNLCPAENLVLPLPAPEVPPGLAGKAFALPAGPKVR